MDNGGSIYIRTRVTIGLATKLAESESNAIIICSSKISNKVKTILSNAGIAAYENVTHEDIKKALAKIERT